MLFDVNCISRVGLLYVTKMHHRFFILAVVLMTCHGKIFSQRPESSDEVQKMRKSELIDYAHRLIRSINAMGQVGDSLIQTELYYRDWRQLEESELTRLLDNATNSLTSLRDVLSDCETKDALLKQELIAAKDSLRSTFARIAELESIARNFDGSEKGSGIISNSEAPDLLNFFRDALSDTANSSTHSIDLKLHSAIVDYDPLSRRGRTWYETRQISDCLEMEEFDVFRVLLILY